MVAPSQSGLCACGEPLPPCSDYYCSRECAVEDAYKTLLAHDSFYRKQVHAVEASTLPSVRKLRRRAAFPVPLRLPTEPTRARTSSTVAVQSVYEAVDGNPGTKVVEVAEDCSAEMHQPGGVVRRRHYKNVAAFDIRGHNGVFSRAKGLGKFVASAVYRRKGPRGENLRDGEREAILPPAPWVDQPYKIFNPETGLLKVAPELLPTSASLSSSSSSSSMEPVDSQRYVISPVMGGFEPLSAVYSSRSPIAKTIRRSRSFSGWGSLTEEEILPKDTNGNDAWKLGQVVEERTKVWVENQN